MMRLPGKGKLRYLLLGLVILVVSWLGYWTGYVSSHHHHSSTLAKLQNQVAQLEKNNRRQNQLQDATVYKPIEGYSKSLDHSDRHQDGKKPLVTGLSNVIVVSQGKPNTIQNRVNKVNARDHAIGLHQGHAGKISQHLNSIRKTNVKLIPPKSTRITGISNTAVNRGIDKDMVKNSNIRDSHNEKSLANVNQRPRNLQKTNLREDFGRRAGADMIMQPGTNGNNEIKNGQVGVGVKQPVIEDNEASDRRKTGPHGQDTLGNTDLKRTSRLGVTLAAPNLQSSGGRQEYYSVIHSGTGNRVHRDRHSKLQAMPDTVNPDAYIFKARSLPKSSRQRPSVANGHLGTAVHAEEVFMNGLYNGRGNDSHRAVIPSTVSFNITETEPPSNFSRTYVLNVGEGIYSEVSESKGYTLTQRIYAHRKYSGLLVVEVDITRKETSTPLKLKVKLNKWTTSYDITFLKYDSDMSEVSYKEGHINSPETDTSERSHVHIFYDHVPNELVPPTGSTRTKWVFLTSIAHTKEDALEAYKQGTALVESNDQLYAEHIETWASVWAAGRIDVSGNLPLARTIYGAYYYILSSMPLSENAKSPFIGLSPTGLPFGDRKIDYQGHVFWDQEMWISPAILPFFPSLARILLGSRVRTMAAAADNARQHGNQGLRFPWESAFTGVEVCAGKAYAEREIHVSGDVSFAVLKYLYATNDTSILSEEQKVAYLLTGVANFWASRVSWNKSENRFEIHGVMPPDEYHKNINNSVYTNAIAKLSLLAPEHAFRRINKTMDRWRQYADDLYIPYRSHQKYHPEYDSYKEGTKVKQADAILLGYPLLMKMDREARRNDLKIYEKVTDVGGPAMSWSMFTIGWLELGDEARAESMFKRSMQYIKNGFQVWHETLFGPGATNFLTGMGGFLQALLNGYGGLRLREDRLDFNIIIPLDATDMNLIGLNYLGSALNIFASKEDMLINLTARSEGAPELVLFVYKSEQIYNLEPNKAVRIFRQSAAILAKNKPLPTS